MYCVTGTAWSELLVSYEYLESPVAPSFWDFSLGLTRVVKNTLGSLGDGADGHITDNMADNDCRQLLPVLGTEYK